MKIAIPLFKERVSPHFSTAPELFVFLTRGRNVCSTSRLFFSDLSLVGKRRKIIGMGIEVLICGGIEEKNKTFFEERGILIIDNVVGEATDVLARFLTETREGRRDVKGKNND